MPIKSKAQRRKFAELLVTGKISEEVYEEWNRSAGKKVLPERLHPKKDAKPKTRSAKSRVSPKRKIKPRKARTSAKGKAKTRKRPAKKTR